MDAPLPELTPQQTIQKNKDGVYLLKRVRLLEAIQDEVDDLKAKYLQNYGVEFDENEDVDDDMAIARALTLPPLRPMTEEQQAGARYQCIVCNVQTSHGFSDNLKLCGSCKSTKFNDKNLIRKCSGNPQLLGKCPIDVISNRGQLCIYCRLKKMSLLVPDYYDGKNLIPSPRPHFTQEGHWGFLMDLSILNHGNFFNFDHVGETGSILIRTMKIDDTNGRHILNDIINVTITDSRLKSVNGIETFMWEKSKISHNNLGSRDMNMLVFVDSQVIPWSPMDYRLAACSYHSMMLVDFLLNPLLNAHPKQQVQTSMVIYKMLGQFLDPQCIGTFLKKRGVTQGGVWEETNTGGIPFEKSKTEKSGCVYATIFEDGTTYVGSNNTFTPRSHEVVCACTKCHFKRSNKTLRSFNVVLLPVKGKTLVERELHEGMVQIIFKFAEFYSLTLQDLNFPIALSSHHANKNQITWPNLDSENIPASPIKLINQIILGSNMTLPQYEEFQNFSRLLFNREFEFNWNWDLDYFRVPVPTPKLEIQDKRETRAKKTKNPPAEVQDNQ